MYSSKSSIIFIHSLSLGLKNLTASVLISAILIDLISFPFKHFKNSKTLLAFSYEILFISMISSKLNASISCK